MKTMKIMVSCKAGLSSTFVVRVEHGMVVDIVEQLRSIAPADIPLDTLNTWNDYIKDFHISLTTFTRTDFREVVEWGEWRNTKGLTHPMEFKSYIYED